MDESEISALYRHDIVKALVAPTRGEGWGLPILDAAVCGLPVIATKWSGHLDFMKQVKFLDLDYNLSFQFLNTKLTIRYLCLVQSGQMLRNRTLRPD